MTFYPSVSSMSKNVRFRPMSTRWNLDDIAAEEPYLNSLSYDVLVRTSIRELDRPINDFSNRVVNPKITTPHRVYKSPNISINQTYQLEEENEKSNTIVHFESSQNTNNKTGFVYKSKASINNNLMHENNISDIDIVTLSRFENNINGANANNQPLKMVRSHSYIFDYNVDHIDEFSRWK